jgi:ectoine utilization protein EutC
VLTRSELATAVGLGPEELAAIEAVFPLVSARAGSMPPIVSIDVPEHHGEVDVKAAYLPGFDGIAVKISAGFFDNPARGLPSLGGLVVLLDATTGIPRAALFDAGYLTDLRTALAGAVAADHLAVRDASQVGVIGAGVQARWQVEALTLVRPVRHVRLWARDPDRATALADDLARSLEVEVEVAATPTEAAAGDVLVTTTPSTAPLVAADALHPGLHVTAVGSDAPGKQELGPDLLAAADVLVCDHLDQSRRLGELRPATEADVARAVELGTVIDDPSRGRRSSEQVTVCDLTGTGAQDTAIASLAVARCTEAGVGTRVDT